MVLCGNEILSGAEVCELDGSSVQAPYRFPFNSLALTFIPSTDPFCSMLMTYNLSCIILPGTDRHTCVRLDGISLTHMQRFFLCTDRNTATRHTCHTTMIQISRPPMPQLSISGTHQQCCCYRWPSHRPTPQNRQIWTTILSLTNTNTTILPKQGQPWLTLGFSINPFLIAAVTDNKLNLAPCRAEPEES
jgi:hypothetical protein